MTSTTIRTSSKNLRSPDSSGGDENIAIATLQLADAEFHLRAKGVTAAAQPVVLVQQQADVVGDSVVQLRRAAIATT